MTQDTLTVPERIRRHAIEHPERPFVVEAGGRTVSYGEFNTEALIWASAFTTLGLGAGDTVVTMVKPSAAAYAAWIGMCWRRAIEAACNTEYRGQTLTYLLTQSRSKVAVIDAEFLPRLVEVAAEVPGLEVVVVLDEIAGDVAEAPFRVITATELLAGAQPESELEPLMPWDIATMIYTSGTTGPSKGVLIAWAQIQQGSIGLIPLDGFDETDVFYSPFPMAHASGRAGICIMTQCGGRFVIRDRFSTSHYWEDITSHGCTTTGLVGAMTTFLWTQPPSPDDAANPLRRAVMMPVVPHYKEFEQRFGLKLTTCYAMSEVGPVLSTGWNITDPASCGTVRDGFEVRLVDEHDFEVPVGEVGELIVRHRDPWVLCQGYFDMPDKTADAWRNGWFHTGDAFRVDEQNRFYFVDRIKDAIRRRGENISSFEVEALVCGHPGVIESAAIPVPSEWGEDEVKVCVVRADDSLTEEQLIRDLISTMPAFMVPRYVEFTDSLPKTDATQRVKKNLLRADPLNGNTWDREAAGVRVR
ncbi:MAG TPA: AMP-binding protein [Acidimicrobiales bacterium]|jgi:crotonobetaine/carnitine-CoA ligase|nr:AMP-binding protein [Acidimicrobiales bacterium]